MSTTPLMPLTRPVPSRERARYLPYGELAIALCAAGSPLPAGPVARDELYALAGEGLARLGAARLRELHQAWTIVSDALQRGEITADAYAAALEELVGDPLRLDRCLALDFYRLRPPA